MIRQAKATAGFALIDLIFVCGIIGILSSIAIPGLLQAKQSAGAASAIGSMRAINSAQLTFALTCGGGFYAPNLTTLGHLPPGSHEGFISESLSVGDTINRAGYVIQMDAVPFDAAPATCNGLDAALAGQAFRAGASPSDATNVRFFATNANGTIFEDNTELYATMPEFGEPVSGHPLR